MQSAVVYSLNHDTTQSFGLCLTPIFHFLLRQVRTINNTTLI